jgi:hypothetical protein
VRRVNAAIHRKKPSRYKDEADVMKKSILLTSGGIAVIHLLLSIGSVAVAFGSGMKAFENPDYQPSMAERLADSLVEILTQPAMSLWTSWMSKNIPDVVEWGLYLLNSLLWGISLAILLHARTLVDGKKPDNKTIKATS